MSRDERYSWVVTLIYVWFPLWSVVALYAVPRRWTLSVLGFAVAVPGLILLRLAAKVAAEAEIEGYVIASAIGIFLLGLADQSGLASAVLLVGVIVLRPLGKVLLKFGW